ncbi:MAG: DUF3565 domain-containing protein, partial [Pseudomonas gingeri]
RAWVTDPAQRLEEIDKPFTCGWCAQGSDKDNLGT